MEQSLSGTSFFIFMTTLIFSAAASAQGPDPNQPDTTIDAAVKTEVIASLVKGLREAYVFPDAGDKVAKMIEDGAARGEYNRITSGKEFSELLTKQIREITHDMHLQVVHSSRALPPLTPKPGAEPPPPNSRIKNINYGFEEVRRLNGNLGYLKIIGFSDAAQGGSTAAGAMAFVANTDALIIDLRENRGGNPSMVVFLASYFFSGNTPVHLNDLAFRKEGTREYTITQWWVLPYMPGQRYVDKEVYILTSHGTPSAAEEFTYDLQTLKRATVVGETTWGGANPGGVDRLGDHFQVFMPKAHAINPITKANWEGMGIKPDIEVPKDDALKVAGTIALEHLIAKTTDEQELRAVQRSLADLKAQSSAPTKQLKGEK